MGFASISNPLYHRLLTSECILSYAYSESLSESGVRTHTLWTCVSNIWSSLAGVGVTQQEVFSGERALLCSTEKETASTTPYVSLTRTSPPIQLYLIVAEHSYPSQSSLIHGFHFPHLPLPLFNVSILVIPSTSSLAVFKAGFIPLYSSRHARDHLQQSRWSFCADKSTCEIHIFFFFFFTYVCVFWSYTCKMTSTTARND